MNFYLTKLCARSSKRAVYLTVITLLTGFLFFSCGEGEPFVNDGELNPVLVGQWVFNYNGGQECYTITSNPNRLIYNDTYMGEWGGNIVHISNFTKNTGVLIIEYDLDKKQTWTDWTTMTEVTPSGNFYGIYYSELKQNSVKLANTSDQTANSRPTETETLEEAKEIFTADNKGDLTYPGGSAQTRQ